jgi:uncharacterized membrane protein YbjE (DUF340 family)
MKGSLIIIGFFISGILVGYFKLIAPEAMDSHLSFYILCGLMFFVGMSVGCDTKTLLSLRKLDPRIMLLPFATILGTLAGCTVAAVLLPRLNLTDCYAVGSGLGYYSLSSIIITQYKGAELGTIALVSNILREIIALLAAPLLFRWFGRLAPISTGGATTMDTTLPIITNVCGKDFVIVSIFHGCITDFSVTFLVTLFCMI